MAPFDAEYGAGHRWPELFCNNVSGSEGESFICLLAVCGESSGSLGVCVGGVTVPSLYGGDPFISTTYQLQSDQGMLAHSIREALVLRNLRNAYTI